MSPLSHIAEKKISAAIANGELDFSRWKGKPLELEDDRFVPADLKMAYKILKNSGFLPPELETRKEIQRLEDLINSTSDEHSRIRQMRKLDLLLRKLDLQRRTNSSVTSQQDYYRRIVERISVKDMKPLEKD
ncbi:MAG: DnaJ family domain-containing protein [Thermodesulfobacteriota bacterium]